MNHAIPSDFRNFTCNRQGLKNPGFLKKPNPAGFIELWVFWVFSPLTNGLYLVGTALTGCI